MQQAPTGWASIIEYPHKTQYKIVCNGVTYTEESYRRTPIITKPMLDKLAIGRVCTGSLDLVLDPGGHVIPKAAEMQVYCRLVSKGDGITTDWMPQGVYYVYTRKGEGVLTLSCLDGMVKAGTTYRDKSYWSSEPQWPQSFANVVGDICRIMGVTLDSRTFTLIGSLSSSTYAVDYPNDDMLISEVLANIGAALGGNWIMTETGKLRLVVLPSATDTAAQTIGKTHHGYTSLGRAKKIKRVCLIDSAGNEFEAGTTDMSAYDLADYPVKTVTGNPITIDDGVASVPGSGNKPVIGLAVQIQGAQEEGTISYSTPRAITGDISESITINGNQVNAVFTSNPRTIYKGSFDFATGILTAESVVYTFDGTESAWNKPFTTSSNYTFRYTISGAGFTVLSSNRKCSHYLNKTVTSSSSDKGYYAYTATTSSHPTYLQFRPDNLPYNTTTDQWKQYLIDQAREGTPLQAMITFTTPQTFQLTQPTITTVDGENTFSSDKQMTLTYRGKPTVSNVELVANCDYATQAVVNALGDPTNGSLYNKVFEPYSVESAYLDPLVELGDVISATDRNGTVHACPVMTEKILCSVAYTDDINAGTDGETEEEFPYLTKQELEAKRALKTNQTYFGNRINRSEGFVSELVTEVGGNKIVNGRTTMNGSTFKMEALRPDGNGGSVMKDCVYFETTDQGTGQGKYVFTEDVEVQGAVTIGNLVDGQTIISGNNIKTGTISGDRLGLTLEVQNEEDETVFNGTASGMVTAGYPFSTSDARTFISGNELNDNSVSWSRITITPTVDCVLWVSMITNTASGFGELSKLDEALNVDVYADGDTVALRSGDVQNGEPQYAKFEMEANTSHTLTMKHVTASAGITPNRTTVAILTEAPDTGERSSRIALKQGNIELTAGNIRFTGLVTFASLSGEGTTTINGDNITTGTVKANHIELAGNMDVKKAIGGTTGGSIGYTTSNIDSRVGGIAITSQPSQYGITGQAMATPNGAKLTWGDGTAGQDNEISITALNARLRCYPGDVRLISEPLSLLAHFSPVPVWTGSGDAPVYLGYGELSYYWEAVYANTGNIITSDRNRKKDIQYDVPKMDTFFDDLKPVSFKMKNGTSGRTHYGMIAQDVEDALTEHGMTGLDFAGFCKDTDRNTGEEHYSLRYEEFIALCIDQIQRLKTRVATLEERITALENRMRGSES